MNISHHRLTYKVHTQAVPAWWNDTFSLIREVPIDFFLFPFEMTIGQEESRIWN